MTPVPVVSTPLNTRTVREVFDGFNWWERSPRAIEAIGSHRPQDLRERLVADPAFVVLPEVPDLTCRTCKGLGFWECDHGDRIALHGCQDCGGHAERHGSGVSPVYAATWQWRHVYADGPLNWHALDDTCLDEVHAVADQRRQVVEWRARRAEPLPVVDSDSEWPDTGGFIVVGFSSVALQGTVMHYTAWDGDRFDVTDEPWVAEIQPGMCVLRLSDWEHLEQPYTAMQKCEGIYIWAGATRTACRECGCTIGEEPHARVPLLVPDGVLSWIELAS